MNAKYRQIVCVPGPAVRSEIAPRELGEEPGQSAQYQSLVTGTTDEVNARLAQGWEIIEVVTGTSGRSGVTGTMFVLGHTDPASEAEPESAAE